MAPHRRTTCPLYPGTVGKQRTCLTRQVAVHSSSLTTRQPFAEARPPTSLDDGLFGSARTWFGCSPCPLATAKSPFDSGAAGSDLQVARHAGSAGVARKHWPRLVRLRL